MSDKPSAYDLWVQAGGDRDLYRELLLERGLLIPLKPGETAEPLPCGWPHPKTRDHRALTEAGAAMPDEAGKLRLRHNKARAELALTKSARDAARRWYEHTLEDLFAARAERDQFRGVVDGVRALCDEIRPDSVLGVSPEARLTLIRQVVAATQTHRAPAVANAAGTETHSAETGQGRQVADSEEAIGDPAVITFPDGRAFRPDELHITWPIPMQVRDGHVTQERQLGDWHARITGTGTPPTNLDKVNVGINRNGKHYRGDAQVYVRPIGREQWQMRLQCAGELTTVTPDAASAQIPVSGERIEQAALPQWEEDLINKEFAERERQAESGQESDRAQG